jgi:hypothetical protein
MAGWTINSLPNPPQAKFLNQHLLQQFIVF